MATVLGLSFYYHDSAAALVIDGKIIAAAAEERFCRRKHTSEFPKRAIEYCLEASGAKSINDLDAIVFYEKPVKKLVRVIESSLDVWPKSLIAFATQFPKFLKQKVNIHKTIAEQLPGYRGKIYFSEHHLSHAASAFFCSPFERAAILVLDGVGELETATIGIGENLDIQLKKAIHFPHSVGLLYSALTSYLGFHVNDGEWKVMGLAPYGKPMYVDEFRKLLDVKADGSFALNLKYFAHQYSSRWSANHKAWERLFGFPARTPEAAILPHHQDLAASGQKVIEELILALAAEASRESGGCRNLVIAGGVGLNSVANAAVQRAGLFDDVWIQPAAGDDGAALGAALAVSQQLFKDPRCPGLPSASLGPEYSDDEIAKYLATEEIPHRRLDDKNLAEEAAALIADGKVLGWFQGRMEFGPRALGARSILADPRRAEMKQTINEKVKFREYFRPFAPAVLSEDLADYFEAKEGVELPFMMKVVNVRPEKRSAIPAVVHNDGTARVQTISASDQPAFRRLLGALKAKTGVPIVLNTSFNVRGEPIVCSPEDAYRCFVASGIDALALGNYLITSKDRAPQALDTAGRVSRFYQQLSFNVFGSAIEAASQISKKNRLKEYPPLHNYLKHNPESRVLDVGCGAGWFVNTCTHFYGVQATGIDLNTAALKQARAVARLTKPADFIQADIYKFRTEPFDVVNSLGVLHHTPDCLGALSKVMEWVRPGGYLHLGLYHRYGRAPFLSHFQKMKEAGASKDELYQEFLRLSPGYSDETHAQSWFRDQVLHPHETQHTYEEISEMLEDSGWRIEATSINRFRAMPSRSELIEREKSYGMAAERALAKGRYFPGFFTVWAQR